MANNSNGEWECLRHIYNLKPVPVQIIIQELLSMGTLKLDNRQRIHSLSIKEAMPLQISMHKPMSLINKQANQVVLNQLKIIR